MKWLNVAGILLRFASFWLAAPELLGERRLRAIEAGIRRSLSVLGRLTLGSFGVACGVLGAWGGASGRLEAWHARAPRQMIVTLAAVGVAYTILMLFQARVTALIDRRVAAPLLRRMLDDERARSRALAAGAIALTVGTAAQIVATIAG